MIPQLIEKAFLRRLRFHHVLVDELPPPFWFQEDVTCGNFSIIANASKERYLCRPRCIVVKETPLFPILESPTTIARDYLTLKYHHSPRVFRQQGLDAMANTSPPFPIYAEPCRFFDGYYVDIRAAYFSIMLRAGWNVDYWPEKKRIARGRPPADFPFPKHSIARNSLVSMGLLSKVLKYSPSRGLYFAPKYNTLLNYQIYRLISDVLQSLAAEALRLGCVYINTDGYIFTAPQPAAYMMEVIRDWGLTARLKGQGPGRVRGVGSYEVGAMKSKRWVGPDAKIREVRKIPYAKWLQSRMSLFTALTTITEEELC